MPCPSPTSGGPELHLVAGVGPRDRVLAAIEAAASNGVDWVQLRDPVASARELYELARQVVAICRPRGVRVAVNDRLDVALAVRADAVQLGARSLPPVVAREVAGALRIGVSVHDREAAERAAASGADWLTFGHVFPTTSHPGEPARGITALAEVIRSVRVPVIAIGGIAPGNVSAALAAGAAGVAVVSAILAAPDPGQATAALRQALDESVAR